MFLQFGDELPYLSCDDCIFFYIIIWNFKYDMIFWEEPLFHLAIYDLNKSDLKRRGAYLI